MTRPFFSTRTATMHIISVHVHLHAVMTWTYFPHYWPCVRGIHRWLVFPSQKTCYVKFRIFFVVYLNKLSNKQSICPWLETTRRSCVNGHCFCLCISTSCTRYVQLKLQHYCDLFTASILSLACLHVSIPSQYFPHYPGIFPSTTL